MRCDTRCRHSVQAKTSNWIAVLEPLALGHLQTQYSIKPADKQEKQALARAQDG
jgi:hypothetical protein